MSRGIETAPDFVVSQASRRGLDRPSSKLAGVVLSLRARILFWYLGLTALALVVAGTLTRQLLLQYLVQRADLELASEVAELPGIGRAELHSPAGAAPSVARILDNALARFAPESQSGAVTFLAGHVIGAPKGPPWMAHAVFHNVVAAWRTASSTEAGTVDISGTPVRYLVEAVTVRGSEQRGTFVVATSMAREMSLASVVTRLSAETGAGALVVASLGAWLVAGRLLRPVRQVTETARSISESDLSRRIPMRGNDEVSALAATFNDMLSRLERAFKAQHVFVQDASHELRTPITIVRGQLEVMGDDPVERAETLALVFDELDRMDRMVHDLLTLTTLAQPTPLQLKPVVLATFVDDMFSKARTLGPRAWHLESAAGAHEAVLDRERITQAVLQLAANAVQHTGPNDPVLIRLDVTDNRIRLSVSDRGPGLAADEHERVFERFSRVASGRPRSDGAGLGLAIVRAIAEAHGGRASVESIPGRGATFTIDIPLMVPAREMPRQRSHAGVR